MRNREPAVIESRACPCGCRMACLTRSRESGCDVIRIGCAGVVGFVTRVAIRRNGCVVAPNVATRARDGGVRTGQWERGFAVIESGRLPGCCVVADLARCRESRGHVVRIRGAVEILHVARRTGGAQARENIVHVATGTGDRGMGTGQRERRVVVIEDRSSP